MIRDGKKKDIPAIVEMSRNFWGSTIYDDRFCPDTIKELCILCINQNLLCVLEVNGEVEGFSGGVMGGLLGNSSIKCGTELTWWINEDHRNQSHGVDLLLYMENMAKNAGIKYWNMNYMLSSMPEIVKSIYEKLGYKMTEVIYTKNLE